MFNNEDDVHFPTLSVDDTLKFALRTKVPRERPDGLDKEKFLEDKRDTILNSLGIPHTKDTKVGNEFIRGVSGGERKRVSLAEVMAGHVRPHNAAFRKLLKQLITKYPRLYTESHPVLGQSNSRSGLQDCRGICPASTTRSQ